MEKPYDEKRLARAVNDILRAVLSTKFKAYYSKLTSTTLFDSNVYVQPCPIIWRYEFAYRFVRGFAPPELTLVGIDVDERLQLYVRVSSDVGSCFDESAKVAILNNLRSEYYGYFDTDMARQYTPPEIQYTLNDIPVPKPFVNEDTYDKIRSTLKKIIADTIGENFDHIIEWRFELEKTPRRASAQYRLCKGALESMLHVVLIFKDGGSNLEVISVSAEDDRIREMASCLPHEIRVRFNPLFNEDEKEKNKMTTSEANYIYSVKMTSEMREACDKITEDARQQTYCKMFYKAYETCKLNAAYGTTALAVGAENKKLSVKEIVINEPTMIVFWEDGTKTVVTARDEAFDAEKGLAMAFAKKALGNNYAAGGRFKTKLKHAKWAPKKQEKKKDIFCEENLRDDAKEAIEGTKKPTKEKPITKTAWIKSMMEEGFTRAEATKAWEKKHRLEDLNK